jgi:hypothetical protein
MCTISYSIPRWRTAISCGRCRSSNMIYYAEMHRQINPIKEIHQNKLTFLEEFIKSTGRFPELASHVPRSLISLRLGFRRNVCLYLHPNLVSSPIKGILEILNLTPRCIPMDILAWTDCVISSAGKIS